MSGQKDKKTKRQTAKKQKDEKTKIQRDKKTKKIPKRQFNIATSGQY